MTEYLDAFEDSEVLLVLNGCTDDTEAVASAAAAGRSNLRILRIEEAVGKGGAVRAGFLAARAPVVGYVDADGATSAAEMRRLFGLMRPGVDGVIASRWTRDAHVELAQPLLRRVVSRAFNALVRLLFGLPYSDTQCGAKIFTRDAVNEIAGSLEVSNFAFDIDILYALRRAGRTVIEVPTVWRDVAGSKIHNVAAASSLMLQAVLRLRMRHSLFRYVIPLFDRFWPTNPLRVRDGLAILILNRRDPQHPQAGAPERHLFEVARRLVARNHRVHWLTAGYHGAAATDELQGISITRVGNQVSVYGAIPWTYLHDFRDRFDIIIDVANGIPFLSPLFSLKPKICLVYRLRKRGAKRRRLGISATNWIQGFVLPRMYANSRFVTTSNEAKSAIEILGVDADRIEVVPKPGHPSEFSWDAAAAALLDIIFHEATRSHVRYVRSGDDDWSVLQYPGLRSKTMRRDFETHSLR